MDDKYEEDFLFYISHAKEYYSKLAADQKRRGLAWLGRLMVMRPRSTREMINRNMHLTNLLLSMQSGKLEGIYAEPPPGQDKRLPPPPRIFPAESECPPLIEEEQDPVVKLTKELPHWLKCILAEESNFVQEGIRTDPMLTNGNTYLAAKALPDGKGAFGFLSVSMEKNECESDSSD